ncbi:MAG: HD domain-containing protein [Salinivirgaceae bacterium]|nr:HD domain-containing protein [Salinivirgaceae bacterium]
MLKSFISILTAIVLAGAGSVVFAQTITNYPMEISVASEEKQLLDDSYKTGEGAYSYNLGEQTSEKTVTLSVSPNTINKLSLVEFCFEGTGKEPQWSQKSSVTFDSPAEKTTVTIKAKGESGLFYKTEVTIGHSRSFGAAEITLIIIVLALALAAYFFTRYRLQRAKLSLENELACRDKEIQAQKMKYDEMLANYMPKEEFEKLKASEKSREKTIRFKMATVLFSDVHGFSNISKNDNAEQLIDDLDRFFYHFDEVVKRFHIEKIKSVGDIYMCAGGIPQKNRTNPIEVVLAAFEMYQYMQSIKLQYEDKQSWNLRIGVHTGPVFCNSNTVNSKKKLEIWGDTVNIASRMEASGQVNKVNITGMTYELVKDYFVCQYWGKMPVKYKGEIDMYLIEGFRPHLSVNGLGVKPNQAFRTRLGLVRYDDIEEVVLNMLEEKLPKNLYYHNLKHTIDVTTQVEIIGRHEGINDEEMLMLKTAALFHDTGFTRTYKDHEESGCEIAREYLPKFDYTPEQIDFICNLIMKTKLPPKPVTLLEQIICDADLDYLGRADFIPVSGNLYRELRERGAIEDDIDKWNMMQIKFIEGHQYFTNSAKQMRDVNKNNQLEAIRQLVKEKNK